jgi:hypothetical protein
MAILGFCFAKALYQKNWQAKRVREAFKLS